MELEDLRLAIYGSFARTGAVDGPTALARQLDTTEAEVRQGIRDLAAARHLAIDAQERILMAHPFASVPLGFAVMGQQTLWWGGCAWDSFALPNLLPDEPDVLVSTRCPACDRALAWVVDAEGPPAGSEVAHFLVPTSRIWDDVVLTCGNQRLFCSTDCVDLWLSRTGNPRGYLLDLGTLWRLAAHWYDGRLDRGYTRRDPTTAAAYFRSVGLEGPFWGL